MKKSLAALAAAAALAAPAFAADEPVLNLYSARHYQTDEALYNNFTKATGIKINRIEAGDEQLVERLKNEGTASPADVLLIVDAARLWQAQQLGLFAPVKSKVLEDTIPVKYRDPAGNWFGFSYRARVIVYNKAMVKPGDVATYESLADPKNKGKVCTRSGSHPYNLSLIGTQIAHQGEAKAEAWAKGVVANMARAPKGGDTDQIKAVAAGECGVALANSYYYARLLRSAQPADKEIVAKTAVIFPDQATYGTHVNISGAGMLKSAPHPDNARKFLEYLASPEAQRYFADGNNEWPVSVSVKISNPALDAMGEFKIDPLPIASYGKYTAEAQKIADRVNWR
ncbi:MAG: Fe(3+) ABC transporter substrate-binding protein [Burkholderiales bacterium]|nr:Fe(3+) ABC transporter substrate-binding protein [Burkholderiales bacterium]